MVQQKQKILICTYYWPPSGGSGVQRWLYFAKHLKNLNWEPIVITVRENLAAFPEEDKSLLDLVEGIRVYPTKTKEPLQLYSWTRARAQLLIVACNECAVCVYTVA